MQLRRSLFLTALASALVRAQSLTEPVDIKDISNWPQCAQECLPLGFGPPVGCGSLYNTSCPCTNTNFGEIVGICVLSKCSLSDRSIVQDFTTRLCGVVIAPPKASSAQDISNWPQCAQECLPLGFGPAVGCGSLSNTSCVCTDIAFAEITGACALEQCNLAERNEIGVLVGRLCGVQVPQDSSTAETISPSASASVVSTASAALTTPSSLGDPTQLSTPNSSIPSGSGSSSNTSTSFPSPSLYTGQAPANPASGFALYIMITVGLLGFVVLGL